MLLGDIEANGAEVTDVDRQTAADQLSASEGWDGTSAELQSLQIDQTAAIAVWSALEVPTPNDDELRALYEQGIEESGIACTAHILVETSAEADEVAAELTAGGDFAQLAAEHSTDTASAANGGAIPCAAATTFSSQYVPEFVEGRARCRLCYDDVVDEGIDEIHNDINARFTRVAEAADVHVDPRIGVFDPTTGVVPLG